MNRAAGIKLSTPAAFLLRPKRYVLNEPEKIQEKAKRTEYKFSKVNPQVNLARSYYDLFDIDLDFTEDELKNSRRRLLLEYHPDKNPDGKGFEDLLVIEKGYETLIDIESRRKYTDNVYMASVGSIDEGPRPTRIRFAGALMAFWFIFCFIGIGFYFFPYIAKRNADKTKKEGKHVNKQSPY